MLVVFNVVVWCCVALLVLSVVGVISLSVIAFRDWLCERAADRQREIEAERLRIRRDALLVKQQLDAQAFAARQALIRAATEAMRDQDGRS